jgi:hypothetical protein
MSYAVGKKHYQNQQERDHAEKLTRVAVKRFGKLGLASLFGIAAGSLIAFEPTREHPSKKSKVTPL